MSTIARAEGTYSETEIDGEVVVMSLSSGDFFSLTGTAREIWKRIDGSSDRAGLLTALTAEFEADPTEITADLDPFLDKLAAAGLILRG